MNIFILGRVPYLKLKHNFYSVRSTKRENEICHECHDLRGPRIEAQNIGLCLDINYLPCIINVNMSQSKIVGYRPIPIFTLV